MNIVTAHERSFETMRVEFERRVRQSVWCSVASIDTRDRTRIRVVHPVWDGLDGWIGTWRHGLLEKHLARRPHLSLAYVEVERDPWSTEQVYVDCLARWDDSDEGRQRFWDLALSLPPPLGFDPAPSWGDVANPEFGVIRLEPWRVELSSLRPDGGGWECRVWRREQASAASGRS